MKNIVRLFADDKQGSAAIVTALSMVALLGFTAIAVDLSSFYYKKRKQQGANDIASLAAAGDLANAKSAVLANLAANGLDSSALSLLEFGIYTPDASLPVAQRFVVSPQFVANSARVTLLGTAPILLGRIFNINASTSANSLNTGGQTGNAQVLGKSAQVVKLHTSAIAAQNTVASFAIGSRMLSLNGGVLNSVLGSMLGSNLSLTAMDYQSLVSANIDLFTFSNALATRMHLTGITYNQLLSGSIQQGDVLNAMLDGARAANVSAAVITAISKVINANSATTRIDLSKLISFGPYGSNIVGSTAPISASLWMLDMLSAVAQIANGTDQVQVGLNLNIPEIASANLSLAIGERPVGTSLVSIGTTGATVHTAQTRLLLTASLVGAPPAALVNVPIYIEVAEATARLSAISCNTTNMNASTVTLGVLPGVVDGWIGSVSTSDFLNMSYKPNPNAATLVNVNGLVSVSGRAHATISNLAETPVTFSYAEINAVTKKTTSTQDFVASLLSGLIGDLQLSVNAGGLGVGIPAGLAATVSQTIATAAAPLDQAISSTLTTLGIGVGQADTWVSGLKCGGAVLVK